MWLIPTKYSTAILFTQLDISNDGDMEPDCYEGNTFGSVALLMAAVRPMFAVVTDDGKQEHRHVFGMVYN